MTRRLAVASLLLVLGGCAHDSKEQTTPAPSPAPTPSAQLTRDEYRAIVHEYRELKPLSDGQDDPGELEQGRQTCHAMTRPDTALVRRVRTDCLNAIDFFVALRDVEHAGSECAGGDALTCAHDRYDALAAAILQTRIGAEAINQELARRGITGLCARSIGITEQQARAYEAAERAAHDAAAAVIQSDSGAFDRATSTLTDALTAGGSGDALAGIERGCRPRGAKPLPRVPNGGINA